MNQEEQIISVLEEAVSSRQLKFLALDLVMKDLDVVKLARLAEGLSAPNRLGFLAEVGAIASRSKGMRVSDKLYKLAEALYRNDYAWVHLNPNSPKYAKKIISEGEHSPLGEKWKVYDTLEPKHIEDWISLYWDDEEYMGQENEVHR